MLWTAGTTRAGYGRFQVGGRPVYAHRLAWELANGPVPDGLHVLHRCDVRRCCTDDHLFLGTNADNNADMHTKGRGVFVCGSKHGMAKLTEAQAVEVFNAGGTQQDIAERHGICRSQVSHIKNRKNWAHATEGLTA